LGDEATASYSLWEVGDVLPGSAEDPNGISVRWIQVAYFIYALGMPWLYLLVLLYLWIMPLTVKSQLRLYKLSEVFYAWSAVEVFILAIIASLLEISQFAQFIIGDKCDGINKILAIFFDKILDGDDKCFDVIATLTHGCWVLFGAAFVFIFVCLALQGICHAALDERLNEFRTAEERAIAQSDNDNETTRQLWVSKIATSLSQLGMVKKEVYVDDWLDSADYNSLTGEPVTNKGIVG